MIRVWEFPTVAKSVFFLFHKYIAVYKRGHLLTFFGNLSTEFLYLNPAIVLELS